MLCCCALALLGCAHAPAQREPDIRDHLGSARVDWQDPRVAAAATQLAALDEPLEQLQVRAVQTLAAQGVSTGQVALAVEDDPALLAEIQRLAPARCARVGAKPKLVLCARVLLQLNRVPVQIAADQELELEGRVLDDNTIHEALQLEPSGRITSLRVQHDERRFWVVTDGPLQPGVHTLEIMVQTERGPEVAALWRLQVGAATAESKPLQLRNQEPDQIDAADGDAAMAAGRFFSLLQRDREQAGIATTEWSQALAHAALTHAQALAQGELLVHSDATFRSTLRSDDGATLSWMAENVARARSVKGARRAILASPSHRRNHLSPDARIAGVGAAWGGDDGRRTLYLVVLFGRSLASGEPTDIEAELLLHLSAARSKRGAPQLKLDVKLASSAREHAQRMAQAGAFLDHVDDTPLSRAVLAEREDLVAAAAGLLRVDTAAGLKLEGALLDPHYNRVGIGAWRADEEQPWYAVVLVARSE